MNFKKLIAAVLSTILIIATLSSCGTTPASTPEEATEQFLKFFAAHKYNKAFDYGEDYDGFSFDDRNSSDTKKIVRAVSDSMSYSIVGRTESDNPVEVVAKITTVDLRAIYKTCTEALVKDMFKDTLSGTAIDYEAFKSNLNDAVIEAANAENAPVCTTDVTFKLNSVDDKWYIVLDDHTFDLVCGYLNSANEWLYNRMVTEGISPEDSVESEVVESEAVEDTTQSQEVAAA